MPLLSCILLRWMKCTTCPSGILEKFWKRMEAGGRKSFIYDEVDKTYQIHASRDILVHYLETIQKDLTERDSAQ